MKQLLFFTIVAGASVSFAQGQTVAMCGLGFATGDNYEHVSLDVGPDSSGNNIYVTTQPMSPAAAFKFGVSIDKSQTDNKPTCLVGAYDSSSGTLTYSDVQNWNR